MISVIVCSRDISSNLVHRSNIKATCGLEHEYIQIDNSANRYCIGEAYQEGIKQSKGDICVFIHDDCFFMELNWGQILKSKFMDETIGMVGVAGSQYLFSDLPAWPRAGRPYIKGRVVHDLPKEQKFMLTVFSWDKEDCDVVAVDGLFFAVRRELFDKVKFDFSIFNGFHLYDMDLCMQVRSISRIIVTPHILVKHCSGGSFDKTWFHFANLFTKKYAHQLPASCCDSTPNLENPIPFENFDLRGKVPQTTIV